MSNHNYNNYYKKNEEKRQTVEEPAQVIPEVVAPAVAPEVTPEVVAPEHAAPAAHVEPETVKGVVFNCAKLNVREKPVAGSRVVKIIDAGTELAVTTDESFGIFCKICTASGVEGYCVKDYVRLV